MHGGNPGIEEEFASLLECMKPLEAPFDQAALAIYRALADSGIAEIADIAAQTACRPEEISEWLDQLPGVYRDEEGNVIGFWGLTAKAVSPHRIIVGGRTRYAWCAWDTLFLPRLLGECLEVHSRCPQTGKPITLTVNADKVVSVEPDAPVLSMIVPDRTAFENDVVSNFCHHIHFFYDLAAAQGWARRRDDIELLSLDRAFALGRVKNLKQFGRLLT